MPQPMADVRVPTMDSLHVNTGLWFENEGDFDDVMSSPHYDFFDEAAQSFAAEAKRFEPNFPVLQKPVSLKITEVNPPSMNATPVNERKRKRDTATKPKSKAAAKPSTKARSKTKSTVSSKSSASRAKAARTNSTSSSKKPSVSRRGSKLNKKNSLKPDCKIEWDSLQIDEETARIVFSTVPKEHIDELLNEGDSPFTRRHVNSGELTDEQKKAIQLVRKRSRAERKSRREKIRRMQVNNLFNELASALRIDPVTKDMASILTAAIDYVAKSRKEIDSLKRKLSH